jgi:hypothetical protein
MTPQRNDEPATRGDLEALKQELLAKIGGNALKIEANGEKIDANRTMIEANGEKIGANRTMIEANGEKIDANRTMIEANQTMIKANGEKIEINSEKISRLIDQAVENHTAIGKMLTREEYKKDYDRLLRGQDQMMVILLRIDQERAATNARLDRLETDVEELKAR